MKNTNVLLICLLACSLNSVAQLNNDCGTNAGFENGVTAPWVCKSGTYGSGPCPTGICPGFRTVLNNTGCLNPSGTNAPLNSLTDRHTITTGAGKDTNSFYTIPVVAPGSGSYSFRLGNALGQPSPAAGALAHAEAIRLSFPVTEANAGFTYRYAVFLNEPVNNATPHAPEAMPRFEVLIMDSLDNPIPDCGYYKVVAGTQGNCPNTSQFKTGTVAPASGVWRYTDWTDVGLDLRSYIGQSITIEFRTADCYPRSTSGGSSLNCSSNVCTTCINGSCCTYPQNGTPCVPPPGCASNPGSHGAYAYIDAYCKPLKVETPSFCAGSTDSIQICAPAGFVKYIWSGLPDTTQCVIINNPVSGTVYSVEMTSITGCVVNTSVTLGGSDVLVSDTAFCAGLTGTVTLNATPVTPGDYNYSWTGPGGFTSNQQNPAIPVPSATGTYSVTQTDTIGCAITKSLTITIMPKPLVDAGRDTTIRIGSSVTLNGTASSGTISWSPAAGLSCDTCAAPVSKPGVTTTYHLMADNNGCASQDSVTIRVLEIENLIIPNILTPNNDLKNDKFDIIAEGFKNYRLRIYNRWGQLMFESNDNTKLWNGKVDSSGKDAPSGVYYYTLILTDAIDEIKSYNGFATLVRK